MHPSQQYNYPLSGISQHHNFNPSAASQQHSFPPPRTSQQHEFAPLRAPVAPNAPPGAIPPPLNIPPIPPYQRYNMTHPMASSDPRLNAVANNGAYSMDREIVSPSTNGHGVLPSPSQTGSVSEDVPFHDGPAPQGTCMEFMNHRFELIVRQHPEKARMCGFGDKDRRPITPAPIIQIRIHNLDTGQEIDYDDKNLQWQKLILAVDLWDVNGAAAANCIKLNAQAPSIAASAIGDYHTLSAQGYPTPNGYFSQRASVQYPGHPGRIPDQASLPPSPGHGRTELAKTLVGQCHTSAQPLVDERGIIGLFFVFQDLSVRTEGWFRLKCASFVLGKIGLEGEEKEAPALRGSLYANGPLVADAWTDRFQVFSAKKFTGVAAQTALSETFAKQGVKIPIRKNDNKRKKRDDDEDDGYDDGADDDDNGVEVADESTYQYHR